MGGAAAVGQGVDSSLRGAHGVFRAVFGSSWSLILVWHAKGVDVFDTGVRSEHNLHFVRLLYLQIAMMRAGKPPNKMITRAGFIFVL